MNAIYQTDFSSLKLINRGKVRDIYDLGKYLLFVASDRISAFDVIMNEPVPGKGKILSSISSFWFELTGNIIHNHFVSSNVSEFPPECLEYSAELDGRSMIVEKCTPFPVEFIVRGYLAGSGWKEYNNNGNICGINLPSGLMEYGELPEPVFTPSTKAQSGHDENIDFNRASELIGKEIAEYLKNISIKLYSFAKSHLAKNQIILADTKFEFGELPDGTIILCDEALTPDSSRFWLSETYKPGFPQVNFDKQVLRDWLESLGWNKMPPPPTLPGDIINKTLEKYKEAYKRITNRIFKD